MGACCGRAQKKHEEKEHAVSEAARLAADNRVLRQEKQQLAAGHAEATRGSSLLQQQLSLYGGRGDAAGVPPDELLRALGIVRRRLDNPSQLGDADGDGVDDGEQVVALRRRLEKVQVAHREASLELDRSKAMLKRYHDICARQQEDIAELTQEQAEGRSAVQRRLKEVSQLAEARRRRIVMLENFNSKLRGRALQRPLLTEGGEGGDNATVVTTGTGSDSMWSDPAGLGPMENLVQVYVVDAELDTRAGRLAGVDPDSLTTVATVDFITFSPMMSPAAVGAAPAFNYMVKFPVQPDHTLLRYFATKTVTVEVHYAAHAGFEVVGRAMLRLKDLLSKRGSAVFRNAPLVMEGREVGTVTVKVRLAIPVYDLWRAFLASHPDEQAELDSVAAAQDAAEKAAAASRAARDLNALQASSYYFLCVCVCVCVCVYLWAWLSYCWSCARACAVLWGLRCASFCLFVLSCLVPSCGPLWCGVP